MLSTRCTTPSIRMLKKLFMREGGRQGVNRRISRCVMIGQGGKGTGGRRGVGRSVGEVMCLASGVYLSSLVRGASIPFSRLPASIEVIR
jgi:hypothetical protein